MELAGLEPPSNGSGAVIRIVIRGRVPQRVDAAGRPSSVPTDNLTGIRYRYDRGYLGGTNAYRCVAGAPLVDLDTEEVTHLVFPRPGRYTVIVETGACDPIGPVTKTLVVTVP
jgi:hypothetical protein